MSSFKIYKSGFPSFSPGDGTAYYFPRALIHAYNLISVAQINMILKQNLRHSKQSTQGMAGLG